MFNIVIDKQSFFIFSQNNLAIKAIKAVKHSIKWKHPQGIFKLFSFSFSNHDPWSRFQKSQMEIKAFLSDLLGKKLKDLI